MTDFKTDKRSIYRDRIKQERPWFLYLRGIKSRCGGKTRNYFKRGIICNITEEEIKHLWFSCGAHKMKFPSIDRIDTTGNYSFKNCRFIELSLNRRRSHARPDNMVVQQIDVKTGKVVNTFLNAYSAHRHTGIHSAYINRVIRGIRRSAKGYFWKLADNSIGYSTLGTT